MTTIGPEDGYVPKSVDRSIFRDTSENIIAYAGWDTETTDFEETWYISTDNGSTWTRGSQIFGSTRFALEHVGSWIDANDVIHALTGTDSETTNPRYKRATIASDGSISMLENNLFEFGSFNFDLVLDSAGNQFFLVNHLWASMGTDYQRTYILEYAPGGMQDFINHGQVFSHGEVNETYPSVCIDSNDVIHIAAASPSQNYETFSGGSFNGLEESVSSDIVGPIALDDSGVPFVPSSTAVWKRTGGTWSSDTYESSAVNDAAVSFQDGEIQIVYELNGTIYHNSNSFGSFSEADRTQVAGGDTYAKPIVRWQGVNNHSPATDVIDILLLNTTTSEFEYAQVTFGAGPVELALSTIASAELETDASGVVQTVGST